MPNVAYPATIYNQEPKVGVATDFAVTQTISIRLSPQEAQDELTRIALALKEIHGEQKVLQIIGQLSGIVSSQG